MKKLSIRNILVPTDFSKMSIQVIEPAKWLAGRFAAAIHLVHVYESGYQAGLVVPAPPFSLTPYEQEAKERVGGALNALAHKYGVPAARCHVLSGTPAFNEICGLAGETRTDLIVMPTHGRTGLEHMFLGSTAERTVRHSPCPVFVMRQRGDGVSEKKAGYKKILVPVDFSGCSREGLRYTIRFAGRFGAKLVVLHVVSLPYSYSGELYGVYQPPLLAGRRAERRGAPNAKISTDDRARWRKSSNSYYDGQPGTRDLLIRGKQRYQSYHHINARTERLKTRIDR